MNLLLLLSALLSALTGVGSVARAPQAATAVTQVAVSVADAAAKRDTTRPVIALPGIVAAAIAPLARGWAIVPAEPIFAARRRE